MQYCGNLKNRMAKQILPGVRLRTMWGDKMLLASVEVDANTVVPPHTHPHEQGGTVVAGTMDLTIPGETRRLVAEDVYIIPGGVEHSVTTGETPVRLLEIFSPVREEYKF